MSASRSTTYCRIKEMGYTNYIPRVKSLLNFKQCKKRLTWTTEKRYWTVGQWSRVMFSDEPKFCISFGNRGPRVWRKSYESDKPDCTKSSIKFPQSIMVWGHHAEECQQLELDPCVFCEQMSLLLSIKKSEHFLLPTAEQLLGFATWLLPIMPNPLRRGLPHMGHRSCLDQQTLWILIPSKTFGESRRRRWLLVDQLLWNS